MLRSLNAYIFTVLLVGLAVTKLSAAGHLVNLELRHLSCYNVCDGKAKAIVSGAVGPVLIKWLGNGLPPNTTGDSIVSVCPGVYTVEVIDQSDNSSTGRIHFEIFNAPPFFWTVQQTPIACFNDSNGIIEVDVQGGTPPYHYQWDTGINDTLNTIDSLPAGTYALQVTDSLGCFFIDTIVMKSPDQLDANVVGKHVLCKNKCDGSVESKPVGGTAPYRYLWDSGDTTALLMNRCVGKYIVTVTDANLCTALDSFTVTAPDSLKAAVNVKDILCKDSCSGEIEIVPSGGVKPYSYSWAPENLGEDSIASNLCEGDYTFTLSDSNGCYLMENAYINALSKISISDSVFPSSCKTCNGTIKVFPSGGKVPYRYVWSTGNAADTNNTLTGICAGLYEVTVTDSNLCSRSFTLVLNDSAGVSGVNAMIQHNSCYAALDGKITVQPIGGTPPFTYSWSPGGQVDSTITGLGAGTYFATVSDSAECKASIQIDLREANQMSASAAISAINCKGSCDGTIGVSISGGSPPYQYAWLETGGSASSASGLCPGIYHLTVTDRLGCTLIDSFEVDTAKGLSLTFASFAASCFGQCDGEAAVSASGGKAPYQYLWSSGSLASNATGLCAGSYTVTVTDANGCQLNGSTIVGEPTAIQASFATTPAQCGFNDGKVKVTTSGGAGEYTYLWFNGTTKDSLTGLTAGVYSLEITDTNGCSKVVQVPVQNTNGPKVNSILTQLSCAGSCDGSAEVMPASSHGPYRFNWTTGDTTSAVSGLCEGTYYVEVTDGKGCTTVQKVVLAAPNPINIVTQHTTPTCFGECDGTATAAVSGGIPPYQFNWQHGPQSNAVAGLCEGNYALTVTDTNNCTQLAQIKITAPQVMKLTFSRKNVSCMGLCSGELTAEVSGGNAPYTYRWSNGATTKVNRNLCTGTYTLEIEDANGCAILDTIAVGAATEIVTTVNVTSSSCGVCDGTANVVASGGNGAPYTYLWTVGNQTTASVTGLCAGNYTVRIMDNLGCEKQLNVAISNTGGPVINDTVTPVSCFGVCDGQVAVRATGLGNLSVFWNDPALQTTDTASGLCAGSYAVLVRDSAGCMTAATIAVTGPSLLTLAATTAGVGCIGDSSGAVMVSPSGGVNPYKYLWSTSSNDTLNTIDTLTAGSYSVIVTDSVGCSAYDTFTLANPNPLQLNLSATNVRCHSACNGTASVVVTGGVPPYQIDWNDPASQTGTFAVGLCSGFYTAMVTDALGCSTLDSIELIEPGIFSLGFVPTNPSCSNGEDGSISLTPSGGTAPYTYQWNNGQKGSVATGLNAGIYTVTGIDANGCTAYDTMTLNNPGALTASFVKTLAQCDSANGSIVATPAGGSGNYSYLWKTIPFQTTQTATKVPAGIVSLTITDNVSLCTADFSVTLNNVGGPATSLTIIDESCFGACNGSAAVTSATAVNFLWNDPLSQVSSTATGLCSGSYTVVSSDAVNCKTVDTLTIKTKRISTDIIEINHPSCTGSCDGNAMAESKGGRLPYSYEWSTVPVQTGNAAADMCAGSYSLLTTDSLGCAALTSILFEDPKVLEVSVLVFNGSICADPCSGAAQAKVNGGTPPYTILWGSGQETMSVNNLCQGENTVTITDANGCIIRDTITISAPSPILANAIVNKPLCGMYNGSITLNPTGGTGPYRFLWSHGSSTAKVSNLFAGVYHVTVFDNKDCTEQFTFFLNNPNAPSLAFAKNTVKCTGDCNGQAMVTPTGGVAPYSYRWDYVPTSTFNTLSDLCSGTYLVKVTDAVGCIAYGQDTIKEPLQLSAAPIVDNPGCGGECVGEVSANPIGGTAPYRFQWNTIPASTTNNVTNLCAGTYSVLVTDTNNCTYEDSVTVTPPPALVVDSITAIDASCNDNTDGQAAVYVSGGTAPYRYFWNNGGTTATIANISGGSKVVLITDTNGCQLQDTIIVGVIDTVLVETQEDFDACFGDEIQLIARGDGVTSYQWFAVTSGSTEQVGNDDSVLVTLNDTTMFVIRGSNDASPACVDRDTVLVNAIPAPLVDAGPDEAIVRGESVVLDDVTPFIPHGFYLWMPGSGLDDSTVIRPRAAPTVTTTYVLSVTDELGCISFDTITVFVEDGVRLYNGFSPNGDGVNDFWTIPEIENYPNAVVEIYSRWGEQVFHSVGYKQKWDGTYEGKALPDGTYYFVIEFNGNRERETGPVTLIR